jgi:hypothetical protein
MHFGGQIAQVFAIEIRIKQSCCQCNASLSKCHLSRSFWINNVRNYIFWRQVIGVIPLWVQENNWIEPIIVAVIVVRIYVFSRLVVENDLSAVALLPGMTRNKWTSLSTSPRRSRQPLLASRTATTSFTVWHWVSLNSSFMLVAATLAWVGSVQIVTREIADLCKLLMVKIITICRGYQEMFHILPAIHSSAVTKTFLSRPRSRPRLRRSRPRLRRSRPRLHRSRPRPRLCLSRPRPRLCRSRPRLCCSRPRPGQFFLVLKVPRDQDQIEDYTALGYG